MSKPANTVDLYLHFPFCEKKCDFCYIDVYKNRPGRNEAYVQSLIREIEHNSLCSNQPVRSVFFGGGTPSLLSRKQLLRVSSAVKENFNVPDSAVFTIESTPNDVTSEKVDAYLEAGISRVSVGIQSFQPEVLKALGRPHNRNQAIQAMELLRTKGIRDVCIELMWAIIPFPLNTVLEDFEVAAQLPIDMLTTMWYDIYQEGWRTRPAPAATRRYEQEFPNLTRDGESVFAGSEQAFFSVDEMVEVYAEATRQMQKNGFKRTAIDELRRANFDVPHGIALNGPGLSFTSNGPLLGFGYDAHSSIDTEVRRYDSSISKYIEDPLAAKSTWNFSPDTLVWYRVVYDVVVPGEFDIAQYIQFAPSERSNLQKWIESAVDRRYFLQEAGGYTLTDEGSAFFNFAFGVENNHDMAVKVRSLFS